MDESWQTEPGDAYSPDRFYTRATDGKGHAELLHLKLPPELASALAQIVQSRAIPEYRTVQDLIRDAIVHRLHYLRESGLVDGAAGTVVGFEEAANRIAEFHRRMQKFEEVIDGLEKMVASLGHAGRDEARAAVMDLYAQALAIQDSRYWRERYVQEIKKRFGYLMED